MTNNTLLDAKIRDVYSRSQGVRKLDILTCTYKDISKFYRGDLRSEEDWNKAVSVCLKCCPSGRCHLCGCIYKLKLIKPDWICPGGEF